ncbi:EpsG family protein [uncultured Sphingomonas sp.]|uniref:EpsG family protein n=1 Tax=uncultured Sphingomonas sp. TaxID=158754 RepID=UPI0025D1DE3E|nr:EpsG family protein [uncultured Sphingomonas sp.]
MIRACLLPNPRRDAGTVKIDLMEMVRQVRNRPKFVPSLPIVTAMTPVNRIKPLLVAAAFCTAFMAVGWVTRFPYAFPDLQNYRLGFESGWYVFSVMNLDWPRFILSEGVWMYGFDELWKRTGDIDKSFFIISCVSTFLLIYYIYFRTKFIGAMIFIANPAFVHITIEQIRSGLAAGIYYFAITNRNWYIKSALLILSLSIHTSFVFFVLFYIGYELSKRFGILRLINKRFFISLAAVFVFAFLVSYLRDGVLTAVGDERGFIQDDQSSGVLLGVGWTLFLVSFFYLRDRECDLEFDFYFFSLNVFMFISSIVIGSYGSRFVAIGIPALAAMNRYIKKEWNYIFCAHYFVFSMVYFYIWSAS